MAVKSLTITESAYNVLKRLKHGNESFSEIIIRVGSEKKSPVREFLGALKLSEKEHEEMLRKLKERRREFSREAEERQARFKKIRESHGSS